MNGNVYYYASLNSFIYYYTEDFRALKIRSPLFFVLKNILSFLFFRADITFTHPIFSMMQSLS